MIPLRIKQQIQRENYYGFSPCYEPVGASFYRKVWAVGSGTHTQASMFVQFTTDVRLYVPSIQTEIKIDPSKRCSLRETVTDDICQKYLPKPAAYSTLIYPATLLFILILLP